MKLLKLIIALILTFIIISGNIAMVNYDSNLAALLPDQLPGWNISGPHQFFNRNNLYNYINGGAELYLSYNFQELVTRTYSAPDQPDIMVDIFDMGNSQDAFGVFSHSREMIDSTFGQGSQYTSGLLLFWKDRYYISILASPETAASKAAVFELAKAIDQNIKKTGPIPRLVSLLPEEGLVKQSIRYFHHYIWLNTFYFISNENILRIDKNTEVVLAKFGDRENRTILIMIKYPTEEKAKSARQNFATSYCEALSETQLVPYNQGKWVGCKRVNNYLVLLFNAPEKSQAEILMSKAQQKISSR